MRLDLFAHPLGEPSGGVDPGAGEQKHELFPPEPSDAVDRTGFASEDVGELPEDLVAGRVAVGVVHRLEPIEVADHTCHRLFESARVREHLLEAALESAAIVETSQRVGLAHVEQLLVGVEQLAFAIFELGLQPLDAQHRVDARLELGEIDRLGDVVVRAGVEPFDL